MARSSSGHAPQPAGSASRGAPQSACKERTKKRRRERSSSSCSKADWGESNDERSSSADCSADLGPKKVRSKEARLKIETVTHSKPGTEEDEQKGGSGNGIAVKHTNVVEAGGVLRVLRGFDGVVLLTLSQDDIGTHCPRHLYIHDVFHFLRIPVRDTVLYDLLCEGQAEPWPQSRPLAWGQAYVLLRRMCARCSMCRQACTRVDPDHHLCAHGGLQHLWHRLKRTITGVSNTFGIVQCYWNMGGLTPENVGLSSSELRTELNDILGGSAAELNDILRESAAEEGLI